MTTGTSPLEQIRELWAELSAKERGEHLDWAIHRCTACGREGQWTMVDGSNHADSRWLESCWCDACCDEGTASLGAATGESSTRCV